MMPGLGKRFRETGHRGQRGLTLVEMVATLAIAGMFLAGVGVAMAGFRSGPEQSIGEVEIQDQLRTATSIIREDAVKAQSFEPGVEPLYGTFRWLDYQTFPATRYQSRYYWEDGVLFREALVEGESAGAISLVRHVARPEDVTFTIEASPNASAGTSEERLLQVTIVATGEEGPEGVIGDQTTAQFSLRPEQTNVVEFQYLFFHNAPTPPIGPTNSQVDLSLDGANPQAATLYNYDVNRDSLPGLTLLLSTAADESDDLKHQDWAAPLSSDLVIDGKVTIFAVAAAQGFAVGQSMALTASLADYDPASGVAVPIGNRPLSWFTSESGWTDVTLVTDTLTYTVPAGHILKVTLRFDGASQAQGMLAYDTKEHLAFLMIPARP